MVPKPFATLPPLRKSLVLKIFLTCFVSVHLPLIAVIAYFGSGFDSRPEPLLLLLLAATLIGTVACLCILWVILSPLRTLTGAVKNYRDEGLPVRLALKRQDEIGVLATAVTGMMAEVESLMQKLRHQALTDPLTGLGNRRWLNERMNQELARAERQSEPISLIVFDLDHFKTINDRHGHDVGDRTLVAAGEVVTGNIRPYDLAARIGGEEFCVVLPKAKRAEAVAIAERLRQSLARCVVEPLGRGQVTASFGVYQAAAGESLHQMLREADRLLYEAKTAGRNCVRPQMEPEQPTNHAETSRRPAGDRAWPSGRGDVPSSPVDRS